MRIQVDEEIAIEVYFHRSNHEEGYEDDICFAIHESGPKGFRLFEADTTSFLLTAAQAGQLAAALMQAAKESQDTPR